MGFIQEMNTQRGFAVEAICRVLAQLGIKVAARTYRWWKQASRPIATRTVTDAIVADKIRELVWSTDHRGQKIMTPEGLYGRRKMVAIVRRNGLPEASFGAVDRAMRMFGLNGIRRAKGPRTTIPAKDGARAGDKLDRDFTASRPNEKWVTDFTYCRTWAGWVYVAFIIDCYANKIVAWHASATMETDLVMVPLKMAIWQREREGHPITPGELVCHSDAGRQYTAIRYTQHLDIEGITGSIGTVGDAYDNALAETINGLFKTECLRSNVFHAGPFKTIADIEYATAGWVEWYNNRRLHSKLNYHSPTEYENNYYQLVNRELQPT